MSDTIINSIGYTLAAKLLHWLMAVLVIGMLGVGLYMAGLPVSPDKIKIYGLHKATGMLILMLVMLRIAWRLKHRPPELPEGLPAYARLGAHAAHWGLYALMVIMPLTGWLMSSAAGFPVSFYGLFTFPDLAAAGNKALGALMHDMHMWLAYLLIGIIALHVLAALWHHFVRRDDVLRRMWFARRQG